MVNYGIIGCGMMGHEHLNNIKLLDGTNISVIFEPNADMAKSALKVAPEAVLADNLEQLNKVYGNMLNAMNPNN